VNFERLDSLSAPGRIFVSILLEIPSNSDLAFHLNKGRGILFFENITAEP